MQYKLCHSLITCSIIKYCGVCELPLFHLRSTGSLKDNIMIDIMLDLDFSSIEDL